MINIEEKILVRNVLRKMSCCHVGRCFLSDGSAVHWCWSRLYNLCRWLGLFRWVLHLDFSIWIFAVFLFAVMCPFGCTAHDLTAGLLFAWTCICLQVAVFTGTTVSLGCLNNPHVCATSYVHLMVLWVYKVLFNFFIVCCTDFDPFGNIWINNYVS
jgi:hypothetical protein